MHEGFLTPPRTHAVEPAPPPKPPILGVPTPPPPLPHLLRFSCTARYSPMNRRYGGMVSAVLKGGLPASRRFLERCKLFTLAESLGGVESLIEHPAIMTHASLPEDVRAGLGISDGLVRLSVGIEDVEDLLAELKYALD